MKPYIPVSWWPGLSIVFIAALIVLGTHWDETPVDSHPTFSVSHDSLRNALAFWDSNLKEPVLIERELLNGTWTYAKGLENETLLSFQDDLLSFHEEVTLPHRVLEPNTALWYQTQLTISKDEIWAINADDGCQVFVNGNQVLQYFPGGFFLMPDGEKVKVQIRVLNNAMHGGLRQIHVTSKAAFDNHRKQLEDYYCLKKTLAGYLSNIEQLNPAEEFWKERLEDFDCASLLALFPKNPVVSPPVVAFEKNGNASIACKTSSQSSATLYYGFDGLEFKDSVSATSENGKLDFEIPDLPKSTKVFYHILQDNYTSGVYTFTTPADKNEAFAFTVWGDSQGGWEVFKKHIQQVPFQSSDFFIGLGDLVDHGCEAHKWDEFVDCLKPVLEKKPVFLVPGNHDYDGYYDDLFPVNYHKVNPTHNFFFQTWGNAVFLSIDLNEVFPLGISKDQKMAFENAINSEAWKTAQWRFLLCHQPVFSQGWEGYHGEPFLQEYLGELLEQQEVDFFLSGHTHDYERLEKRYGNQNTHFVITGGGGGGIEKEGSLSTFPQMDTLIKTHHYCRFEIDYNHCKMEVYNEAGEMIDHQDFSKPLQGIDK